MQKLDKMIKIEDLWEACLRTVKSVLTAESRLQKLVPKKVIYSCSLR